MEQTLETKAGKRGYRQRNKSEIIRESIVIKQQVRDLEAQTSNLRSHYVKEKQDLTSLNNEFNWYKKRVEAKIEALYSLVVFTSLSTDENRVDKLLNCVNSIIR
jgi:molecular chaperone GrpE (heat shock protein)